MNRTRTGRRGRIVACDSESISGDEWEEKRETAEKGTPGRFNEKAQDGEIKKEEKKGVGIGAFDGCGVVTFDCGQSKSQERIHGRMNGS